MGEGVHEARIDYGPGYRVYFGNDGETLLILLLCGDKRMQDRDIMAARRYWADDRARKVVALLAQDQWRWRPTDKEA